MSIVIEPESVDDIVAVRNVVRRAFHHHQSVADMVDLIRASPQYVPELALTARISRDVVGFVMLSPDPPSDRVGSVSRLGCVVESVSEESGRG